MGGMKATTAATTYTIRIDIFRVFPALRKPVRTATRAIEEDQKQNYPKALRLYKQAIKDFHRAMEREALSDLPKEVILHKCATYSDRIAWIKEYLDGNSDKEGLIDSDDERPKRRFWFCCC
ncbi:vacuolar protein sorting-associated protein 4 [Rhipicephalus sanguineus]|uniref:vacuolar protein sorting-associated protein 4 n=1 Tax=Rhipicephalus sanguineus TaxID=34632 RepID=UPI00189341EC|nr:vacuolar protein sorting-associated protein 4 [Rhipicephalus sanguineus]